MSADETTVVVAEDDHMLIALVRASLRRAPWRVLEATTGPAALALARSERPSLVLLDVGLPELDGYEVCRRLKGDPATAGVDVVMLTARAAPADRARATEAGADGYLTKPFSPSELLEAVRALLAGAGETDP